MKYFMLIWAGLWRKKTRTILTMLSIIVAFLLFGLLQGINQGIKAGFGDSGNNRLWTTSRMSAVSSMPISLMDKMQIRQRGAQRRAPEFLWWLLSGREKRYSGLCNQCIDEPSAVYPELNITPDLIAAMKSTRARAVIGRPLGEEIRLECRRQDSARHDHLDQQGRQQQLGF